MQNARKGYIETQCDEKIRRALRHPIRSHMEVYSTGDKVYFKKDDSNRWRGPGTVIGQDRQVVFVRHGGVYIRVSTCRLKKANEQVTLNEPGDELLAETEKANNTQNDFEIVEEAENIPAETTNNIAGDDAINVTNEQLKMKKGDHIRYRFDDDENFHVAEILGNAGKKTGNNRHWYNVKEGEKEFSIDLSSVRDLSIEEQIETVNIVMVPRREHGRPEIIEAKKKELEIWKEMGVYEPVPDIGQACIQTSWVITEKEDPPYKARLCARGDQEMCNVKGDSPTVSKMGIRIFLSIAAAEGFEVSTKDVRSAFLQGKEIERTVYVNPPSEAKQPFVIWKLKKAVYGLGDAARNWYDSILKEMMEIGCKKSLYEDALFYLKENDKLLGMMATHVDDFLNAGNAIFNKKVINVMDNRFDFGREIETDFRYVGINVTKEDKYIVLDQSHYVDLMEEVHLPSGDHGDLLSEKEKKLYRGIVGSINWVSLISRPDVCFEVVDLSTKFQAPTVGDLLLANKVVRKIKSHNVKLKYSQLKINEKLKLVAYSDGSFKNLCNGVASGSGRIIFLVDENQRCSPITWNSNKLKKVVDSTLAAESMSLSNAVKEAIYIKHIIKELIGERSPLPIFCVVDSRGTRDAVYSTKLVDDKITRLYIAQIKQCLESGEITKVLHVPGEQMLADCLTKRGASTKLLLKVLQDGILPELDLR